MSALTSGFVGIKLSYNVVGDTKVTGCGSDCVEAAEVGEDLVMLYPTKHDINWGVTGKVPIPLSGGVILKIPGPKDEPNHAANDADRLNALLSAIRDDGMLAAHLAVEEEEEEVGGSGGSLLNRGTTLGSSEAETEDYPAYFLVNQAKKELNRVLYNISKNEGLTTGYKNLEDLKIIIGTSTIEDPSKIETGNDCAISSDIKSCFELTYIPLEVICGTKSIAQMFGERFKNVYGVCGNSYDRIADYMNSDEHSGPDDFEGDKVLTQDGEITSAVADLMGKLGGGIDILALLAGLFNLDFFPLDIEAIIMALAGDLVAEIAGAIGIEFGEMELAEKKRMLLAQLLDVLKETQIRELLLEFFPIQNVEEELVRGTGKIALDRRGFYTMHKGEIFIKLPNMSCMDAAGFVPAGVFYDTVDGKAVLNRVFFIEQHYQKKITRWGFLPLPPPAPLIENGNDITFPETSDVEFLVDGINLPEGQGKHTYFLSPIADPVGKLDVNQFQCNKEGRELFTAPLITRFIFAPSEAKAGPYDDYQASVGIAIFDAMIRKSVGRYGAMGDLFETSTTFGENKDGDKTLIIKKQNLDGAAAESVRKLGDAQMLVAFMLYELGDLAGAESTVNTAQGFYDTAEFILGKVDETEEIRILNIGFPLTDPSQTFAGDAKYLIGEKNRADLILAPLRVAMSGSTKNNRLHNNPGINGLSNLYSSNRPKFCSLPKDGDYASSHIPEFFWIPCSEEGKVGESIKLKVKADELKLRFVKREVKFALYAVDIMGQIARAPNGLISFDSPAPSIEEVLPSGCAGGGRITTDTFFTLRIVGSDLGNVKTIVFDGPNQKITFSSSSGGDYNVSVDDETIQITFAGNASPVKSTFGSWGFTNGEWECTLIDGDRRESKQEVSLYVSLADEELPSTCSSSLAYIPHDSFSAPGFDDEIYGVPLYLDESNNANIEIGSKSKLFSGKYDGLHAYLAVQIGAGVDERCDTFSFAEDRIEVFINIDGRNQRVILIKSIEYEFSASALSGFYKKPTFWGWGSGKKAIIEFPGKYNKLNFTPLVDMSSVFFIVTNRKIDEYEYTDNSIMDDGTYSFVRVGDNTNKDSDGNLNPGFIVSPRIAGIIALVPEKVSDGTTTYDGYNTLPMEISANLEKFIKDDLGFGGSKLAHRAVKTQGYFQNLAIIFTGSMISPDPEKSYSFFWGKTPDKKNNLKKKLKSKIKKVPGMPGYMYAVFEDVSTTETGSDIGLFLTHADKKFNPLGLYSSETLYFKATTNDINYVEADIDDEDLSLTLPDDINKLLEPLLAGPSGPGNDALTKRRDDGINHYLIPIKARSNIDMAMPGAVASSLGEVLSLKAGEPVANATGIGNTVAVTIPKQSVVPHGDYFTGEVGGKPVTRIITTIQISPNQPAWVVPEIYQLQIGGQIENTEEGMKKLDWGKQDSIKVWARGASLTKDWAIVFDVANDGRGAIPLINRSVEKIKPGDFMFDAELSPLLKAAFATKPKGDGNTVSCMPGLGLSDTNLKYDSAKATLGSVVTLDMTTVMKNMMNGPHKNKRRSPGLWKPVPKLTLGPVKLQLPVINPALMQSFCDFSFHLTGELKVHLEQFYILCIPIQVLLCIIDVICALLNPFKLVLAIIRLFECLFDLLLLLPQISIPVMFLNLVLHLLEILECIIRKILWLILAINALVIAFKNAIPINPETNEIDYRYIDWEAIQTLEETIGEYLFDMEADLDFLGPVMSVLGMFLQLLQLLFRFPCRINPSGGSYICGIDGSMLGGLIRGKAMPAEGSIDTNYLLPVAQVYSKEEGEIKGVGKTDDERTVILGCFSGSTHLYLPHMTSEIGKVYAQESDSDGTLLTNLIDDGTYDKKSYRAKGSGGDVSSIGDLTFTASITKSVAGFNLFESDPKLTTFHFNSSYEGWCFPVPWKPADGAGSWSYPIRSYIDLPRPGDSPLVLFDDSDISILKTKSGGNFVSPHDGYSFLKGIETDLERNVKPLTVTFEWSEFTVNPDTGEMEEEIKSVTNTYDEIPSLAIIDGNGDVYFPTKFYFGDDSSDSGAGSEKKVIAIDAKVINRDTAQMLAKSKETRKEMTDATKAEVDTCNAMEGNDADGYPLSDGCLEKLEYEYNEYKTISYPQIMFFDMRQIEQELEDLCMPAQMNAEVIPDEEPDELIDIVQETSDCIQKFIDQVNEQRTAILDAMAETPPGDGETWLTVPDIPQFDVEVFTLNGQTLKDCLNDSVDKICKFVVNPLTTSFKVLEDTDTASVGDLFPELVLSETYSDGAATMLGLSPAPPITAETLIDPDPTITDEEFLEGSKFIGAREYAAGIGDNAAIKIGSEATIQIIPRDIYNEAINENADLTSKIELEILSDGTGDAEFELYEHEDGEKYNVRKMGEIYEGKLSSGKPGVVKLKVSICLKTIKAFANAGLSSEVEVVAEVDCIDTVETEEEVAVTAIGGIVKVDRILTILFVSKTAASIGDGDDAAVAKPGPQTFGTSLEN